MAIHQREMDDGTALDAKAGRGYFMTGFLEVCKDPELAERWHAKLYGTPIQKRIAAAKPSPD